MTTIYVKAIPKDLAVFIIQTQWDMKCKKGMGQYSQSQTIVHMLNEYKKMMQKNDAKK